MVFPFPLFSSHYVDISSSPWRRPRLLPTTTNEVYADGSCLSLVTSFVSLPSWFPSWLSYRYAASRWPETRRDGFVICSHSVIPLPFMDLIIVNCLCHPAHSMETVEWVVKKGSPGSRFSGLREMSHLLYAKIPGSIKRRGPSSSDCVSLCRVLWLCLLVYVEYCDWVSLCRVVWLC